MFYTCNTGPCLPIAQIVQANLAAIEINTTIVPFPTAVCFTKTGTRGEPFDLANCTGWHANVIDGYEFIRLSDGATIQPANNVNWAYFDDPIFNARILAARRMPSGPGRDNTLSQIDVDITRDASPYAPFMVDNSREFFSRRIGCHAYDVLGSLMNLAALCERPAISVNDVQVTEAPPGPRTRSSRSGSRARRPCR